MKLQHYACSLAATYALTACVACGSVNFGEDANNSTQEQTQNTTNTEQSQTSNLDCDALMQQLADNCFAAAAFEADGSTPLHIIDEAGNDLGEVDQTWAAHYCECYAQLAFQTFGCEQIVTHQNLADDEYDKLYSPIIASCEEVPNEQSTDENAQTQETTAPSAESPTPTDVDAQASADTDTPAADMQNTTATP